MGLTGGHGRPPKYPATERAWVRRILTRLTQDQRRRYEEACKVAARHHSSGRLYDSARARIAERIMYEDHQKERNE